MFNSKKKMIIIIFIFALMFCNRQYFKCFKYFQHENKYMEQILFFSSFGNIYIYTYIYFT